MLRCPGTFASRSSPPVYVLKTFKSVSHGTWKQRKVFCRALLNVFINTIACYVGLCNAALNYNEANYTPIGKKKMSVGLDASSAHTF